MVFLGFTTLLRRLADPKRHDEVFETQYLQLQTSMVKDANVYGMGETVSISGFRRDSSNTTQAMWARDSPNPVNENECRSRF